MSGPTVEEALKELREMFPAESWLTCREMARYYDRSLEIGRYAEIEFDTQTFRAATLADCMAQVRMWKEGITEEDLNESAEAMREQKHALNLR